MTLPTGNKVNIQIVAQLLDRIQEGIHVVDINGHTLFYNEKMRNLEATEDMDLLDKRLLDVFRFHPDENSTLLQVLATKQPIINVKQTYFNANGIEITTLNDSYPIIVEGEIVGAVEIARDVSTKEQIMKSPGKTVHALSSFDHWTGTSPLIRDMIFEGKKASKTNSMILLIGEPGCGKERLAQSIHLERRLSSDTFHAIDCRSIQGERLHEEIFAGGGFLSGEANGTWFLDHLEYMDIPIQKRLTKELMEWKKKHRNVPHPLLYPILTVSKDPIDAIQSGRLDKELYYMMSDVTIFVPSLRQRKKDIPAICHYFINNFNERFQTKIEEVSHEVISLFTQYEWPGNVRELEHVIEASMFSMGHENILTFTHLPHYFRLKFSDPMSGAPPLDGSAFMVRKGKASQTLDAFLKEAESYYIQKSLQYHDYNITKTADALGMSRQNLQYRLKKNNLSKIKRSGTPI
ncbi:sigma-54-dependent Fis family transcriptional regulator [Jeotgalibacillus soli]|uniref:Transcriptional regulator n=1 Tax=Jeotgalibacillus soli TaxID=889306 RepID=A0A0C2V0J3_9BACL|nr:sigma-54-dependent Fis family transcriptional regulator [Jeotgalibacillus soli]KIL42582.1 hypothetical protein KP78_38050 [Jeotgalibacillus soli]